MAKTDQLRQSVYDCFYESSVTGALAILAQPPGKVPREDWVRLSHWYHGLPEADVQAVRDLVALAASLAVFNMCVALDQLDRVIEDDDLILSAASTGEDLNPARNLHAWFRDEMLRRGGNAI